MAKKKKEHVTKIKVFIQRRAHPVVPRPLRPDPIKPRHIIIGPRASDVQSRRNTGRGGGTRGRERGSTVTKEDPAQSSSAGQQDGRQPDNDNSDVAADWSPGPDVDFGAAGDSFDLDDSSSTPPDGAWWCYRTRSFRTDARPNADTRVLSYDALLLPEPATRSSGTAAPDSGNNAVTPAVFLIQGLIRHTFVMQVLPSLYDATGRAQYRRAQLTKSGKFVALSILDSCQ